jgi:hypothetical protein
MSNSDKLRLAGDVNIKKVQITSMISNNTINITNQVMAIQIYEDLFSPFTTGSIIIKDSLDLVNWLPFLGQEYLDLDIFTPTLDVSLGKKGIIKEHFYIYKITNREYVGEKSVVYQIHFISPEAIVDLNSAISRPFYGKISDMVGLLSTNEQYLATPKRVQIEDTGNSTKFVSNFWSIVKCINYLANLAKTPKDDTGYLFFENRYGFNFVTLDFLNTKNVYQKFTNGTTNLEVNPSGGSARILERDFQKILELSVPNAFDYIDRIRNGTYASKLTTHDWTTKRFSVHNYDYLLKFNPTTRLNQFPITNNDVVANVGAMGLTMEVSNQMFSGFGDVTNRKTIQDRISRLKQAEAFKVRIVVKGRTDYTVGMKVELDIYNASPTKIDDTEKDLKDKQFCGYYIISAINHYIDTITGHECHMEVIKDSLKDDPSKFGNRSEAFFEY